MASKSDDAMAIFRGAAKAAKEEPEETEDDSSDDARAYFDEFASALADGDNDGAYEAFQGAVRACKSKGKDS